MNWQFTQNRAWSALQENYSWIADMAGVQQSSVHHAEGDVLEHTRRVVEAVEGLTEYGSLTAIQREILWVSALLHDVEKRSTTRMSDEGDLISPGHAKRGELTARHILYTDAGAPFQIREEICAMVRYHGLPIWLMDKPDPQKAVLQASLRLNTALLALLARADVHGRICSDADSLLQKIELFQLYCEEQGCWQTARAFLSAESRYRYFQHNASLTYQPYDDYRSRIYVMSGLPGMGKDRYIQRHLSQLPIVSLDEIRRRNRIKPGDRQANGWVVQQAKEQARTYLRQSVDFVWNATNITRQMRTQLIELFSAYQAKITIIYVEVPYKRWLSQNSDRNYAVPKAVIDRMLSKLEPPTQEEAHCVIYHIDEN